MKKGRISYADLGFVKLIQIYLPILQNYFVSIGNINLTQNFRAQRVKDFFFSNKMITMQAVTNGFFFNFSVVKVYHSYTYSVYCTEETSATLLCDLSLMKSNNISDPNDSPN